MGRIRVAQTVGDAMLRHPTVHPADLSVEQARAAFDSSPKTHLLLLTRGSQLIATVCRADLQNADPMSPAVGAGTLRGRTVDADASLAMVHASMVRQSLRRLAVVDADGNLVGLLCLKSSLLGFCSDEGVAALRAARTSQ